MRKPALTVVGLAALLATAACGPQQGQDTSGDSRDRGPSLRITTIASGLDRPWDIGFIGGGRKLVSERAGRFTVVERGGKTHPVRADLGDVYAETEGGLMGLALRPDFQRSREFVACQTHMQGGRPVDIRLVTWRLSEDTRSAQRVGPLLSGLPINPGGRHSGCRPTFAPDGMLLVGTGDTADPSVAQDRGSLGGKVLRIDPRTGKAPPDNPFARSDNPRTRYISSYGHRNIQGVAVQPGTGRVYTAEHGPSFDDEVNVNRPGGNYGWDPSKGGTQSTYDESVPMTDTERFPDAVRPLWTSGDVTQAISGAAFTRGKQWGDLDGALAVAALKGQKLLLYKLTDRGRVRKVLLPGQLDDSYGRLRAVRTGPDGALYVTTSDGGDDKLLRITRR